MARPPKDAAQAQDALLTLDTVPEMPVEEQPYPLPEGWKWVRLGDCNCYTGEIVNPHNFPKYTFELYSVPSSAIDYPEIILGIDIGSSKQAVEPGDVLLCKINPRINRVWFVTGYTDNKLLASSEWIVFRNKNILPKYMMFCMRAAYFREFMLSNVSGVGGSLMRAQPKHVRRYPIPLPPLEEQQRIVERIESLFAKLDEAREKAESALESFERRKAAILHKAFTGELTRKWREENGIDILTWEKKELGSIASLQTGLMKGRKFSEPTILKPYLRVANVQDGFFDLNEIKQIKIERGAEARWALKKHDVLFTEGGDFDKLGRGAVWEEQILDCLHQNHIFVVRVNDSILNPYFLSYQARSIYGKKYFLNCAKQTTNLASINSTQLKNFPVLLPSLPEQQEIVRILDRIFAREQQAREAAQNVLQRIDQMKKAILARAFRGELG